MFDVYHTFAIITHCYSGLSVALPPRSTTGVLPSRRSLRSVGTNRLTVPPTRLSTVGSRAFPVVGPQTWNNLPEDVTSADSLSTFAQDTPVQKIFSGLHAGYQLTVFGDHSSSTAT